MKGKFPKIAQFVSKYKPNVLCFICVLLYWAIWKTPIISRSLKDSSESVWIVLILCVLCVTPRKNWMRALIITVSLNILFTAINEIKIWLIRFPITIHDIIIFIKNPIGLFDSVGMPRIYQYGLFALFAVLIVMVVSRALRSSEVYRSRQYQLLIPFFTVILVFVLFCVSYKNYIYRNRDRIVDKASLWSNREIIRISRQLGVLGFMAYAYHGYDNDGSMLSSLDAKAGVEDIQEIYKSVSRFILNHDKNRILPNIVFVFAESTFDPNSIFLLSKRSANSLFEFNEDKVGGLLHVSTVGGGSWKTEFDTITGLDCRLFGVPGEYTHVMLAPYIKQSFVRYLKDKYGYFTEAFYPVSGKFYGARRAYKNYGFDEFKDSKDLDLLTFQDTEGFDELMTNIVLSQLHNDSIKPFFSYIVLAENHSPHPCKNFSDSSQFSVTFAADNDFERSCMLNEFNKRSKSTEIAVNAVIKKLQKIENESGRPFIVVIFGDHQPLTFVSNEFNVYRNNNISQNYTFYSITASKSIRLPKVSGVFNSTLLPTLVSTMVANSLSDVYLPENLYIFEKCGDTANLQECQYLHVLARAYKNYITQ